MLSLQNPEWEIFYVKRISGPCEEFIENQQCDQTFFSEPARLGLKPAKIARHSRNLGCFCEKIASFSHFM